MAFKGKTIQGVLLKAVNLFVVEQTNFFPSGQMYLYDFPPCLVILSDLFFPICK